MSVLSATLQTWSWTPQKMSAPARLDQWMMLKLVAHLVPQVLTSMLIRKLVWIVVVTAQFAPDQLLVLSAILTIYLYMAHAPVELQLMAQVNVFLVVRVSIGQALRAHPALLSQVTALRAWIQVENVKLVQVLLNFHRHSLVTVQLGNSSTDQLVWLLLLVRLVNIGPLKTLAKLVVPIASPAKIWQVSVLRAQLALSSILQIVQTVSIALSPLVLLVLQLFVSIPHIVQQE